MPAVSYISQKWRYIFKKYAAYPIHFSWTELTNQMDMDMDTGIEQFLSLQLMGAI